MTIDPKDTGPGPQDEPSASAIDEAVARYVDALTAGRPVHRMQVLLEHPGIGHEILERLEDFLDLNLDDQVAHPLGGLGDYTLRRQIGRGGMGVVYEAWENSMDRRVALKVLPAAIAADDRAVTRFVREARVAGKLNHPSVVSVYGMGVKKQTPYYAMEFVEGETLAQILAKERRGEGEAPFGDPEIDQGYYTNLGKAFADVADGLQHAHSRGVIHRDIKPSNLILERGGDQDARGRGRLRILDFGLARLEGQESVTMSGDVVGTPLYMSPEQARQRKVEVDHRTDIYSLGATLYEMLARRPPFKGKDHRDTLSQIIEKDPVELRKRNPRIPKDIETIVLKCLRKGREDRYGTAEALAQDLRRFVRGDAVEARPQARWERIAGRVRRHRGALAGAVVFLILLSSIAWLLWRNLEGDYERDLAEYDSKVLGAAARLHRWRLTYGAPSGEMISIDPQHLFLPGDLPVAQREAGSDRVPGALEDLSAAARILPGKPEAYYYRARGLALLGRRDEALAEVQQALRCDPCFIPALILEAHLSGGQRQLSESQLSELMAADRVEHRWARWMLSAYRAVKDERWNDAVQAHEKLIGWLEKRGEPYLGASIEMYLERGIARLEAQYFAGAIRDFVGVSRQWPLLLEPALLLGKAYYLQGEKGEAERIFKRLCDLTESKDEAVLWISAVYHSLRDYEKGLGWVDHLEDESVRDRLRGVFLYYLHRWPEAIAACRNAVRRNPEDPIAHTMLGASLVVAAWNRAASKSDGEYDEAVRACPVPRRSMRSSWERIAGRFFPI